MNWSPTRWEPDANAGRRSADRWYVESVRKAGQVVGYAVLDGMGNRLSHEGVLSFPASPSERTDEWNAAHRWPSLETALAAAERAMEEKA